MKSDRRNTKINKIQPSNVTKSSQYCFTSGDDKAEKSVDVKINALEAELKKNTYFIYINDNRLKREFLLINSVTL